MSDPNATKTSVLKHKHVVNSVANLIRRKMLPDLKNIHTQLRNRMKKVLDLDPATVEECINDCMAQGLILKVQSNDGTSFRTPGSMIGVNKVFKVVPYSGDVKDSVVEEITKIIGKLEVFVDDTFTEGTGVDIPTLMDHMHADFRFLNYDSEMVEKVLQKALSSNCLYRVIRGKYSLTDDFRQKHRIQLKSGIVRIGTGFRVNFARPNQPVDDKESLYLKFINSHSENNPCFFNL